MCVCVSFIYDFRRISVNDCRLTPSPLHLFPHAAFAGRNFRPLPGSTSTLHEACCQAVDSIETKME